MQVITYPSAVKWYEKLTSDPAEHLGKNNRARLRSTLNKISETTITHEVSPLTTDVINWFTPLYQSTISQKANAQVADIYGSTIGKGGPVPYFALILYENEQPIGATIFAERKSVLTIAYRIYPNHWSHHKLQANPSLYTEYLIRKHASERGYEQFTHGRDRNPYGVNSSIGLALFKLSVGCRIYLPSKACEFYSADLKTFTQNTLVFLQPPDNETQIKNGIFYTDDIGLEKFFSVTKYPQTVNIQTIRRTS